MRIFKLFTVILISSISILAQDKPKDTLWTKYLPPTNLFTVPVFSNDSKKVYANTLEGTIVIDSKTGDSLDFFPESDKMGFVLAESEDNTYIINRHTSKYNSKTKELIWDCPTRKPNDFYLLNQGISENAKILVIQYVKRSGSQSNDSTNIDIYDTKSQTKIRSIYIDTTAWTPLTLAISNDAKFIALSCYKKSGSSFYTVQRYLYNAENGKLLMQLNNSEDQRSPYMFSSNSNYFILRDNGYSYGYILIVNLKTLQKEYYNNNTVSKYCFMTRDEKFLVFNGASTNSGVYLMYLGDSVSNLNSKPLISVGDKLSNTKYYNYAKMSNNNKYILVGTNEILYCLDFEKVLAGVTTQIESGVSLFPNPTKDKLTLTNPQNHQINTLTAYDILGRTYPLSANGNEVDVSALAAGKYFLKVGLANGSILDFGFVKE